MDGQRITRKQVEQFAALLYADEVAADLSDWRENTLRRARQRTLNACADLIQEMERTR